MIQGDDDDQVDFVAFAAFNASKRGAEQAPPRRAIRSWQWILAAAIPFAAAGLNAVKRYVATGWTGDLTTPATKGRADLTRNIRYGLGHLAVGCLVKQHGLERFLTFFEAYARRRELIDNASQAAFGTPWAQTNQRCATEIRRQLR